MFIDLAKIMSGVVYKMLCTPMWDMITPKVASLDTAFRSATVRPERDREPETAPMFAVVPA